LPLRQVVASPAEWQAAPEVVQTGVPAQCFTGDGVAINSPVINGLVTEQAKEKMADHLHDLGVGRKSIKYKLRDWLFSRQRYWGEPFPIVLDSEGNAFPLEPRELPLTLPELADCKPNGSPEQPLS